MLGLQNVSTRSCVRLSSAVMWRLSGAQVTARDAIVCRFRFSFLIPLAMRHWLRMSGRFVSTLRVLSLTLSFSLDAAPIAFEAPALWSRWHKTLARGLSER